MKKLCTLTNEQCQYVKDGKDYSDETESICNIQALKAGRPYEISKMKACPGKGK